MKHLLSLSIFMVLSIVTFAQPPYAGTIFIDPDIITAADPSSIQSTTYTGQGMVIMYDRRVPAFVTVNAYLFDVVWSDGITSRAQVNPEFGSVAAATIEAQKYAALVGQLPACLREDAHEIWIQAGTEPFGGSSNTAILIHTGQSVIYENDGILEETLVHEASHTSLDATHAASAGWLNAQILDNNFISTYAQDNPTREDIAESFLTWFAVRHRPNTISVANYNIITQTIPNRLIYFDGINCSLFPLPVELVNFRVENSGNVNIVSWQTATEKNNERFEVERSQDGKRFQYIGEIKGKGTTNDLRQYKLTDFNPPNGVNYYRLKQLDFDGRINYSKIVSIDNAYEKVEIGGFYPNPTKSGLVNLDYTSLSDSEINVTIYDLNGKLIVRQNKLVNKGNSILDFNFSSINKGMYIVKIEGDKYLVHRKLVLE